MMEMLRSYLTAMVPFSFLLDTRQGRILRR